MMKFFILLCAIAATFALTSVELTDDNLQTLNLFRQNCKASTTASSTANYGGTACLVWNFDSTATITGTYYIAHSLEVFDTIMEPLEATNMFEYASVAFYKGSVLGTNLLLTKTSAYGSNIGQLNLHTGGFSGISLVEGDVLVVVLTMTSRSIQFVFSEAELRLGRALASRNHAGTGPKFSPTYFETVTPYGSRVLLARQTVSGPSRTLSVVMTVVASGVAAIPEGAWVIPNLGSCFRNLVQINGNLNAQDDVLAFSQYCIVPATDVLMIVGMGANRANRFTGHLRKAHSTSYVWAPRSTFEPFPAPFPATPVPTTYNLVNNGPV